MPYPPETDPMAIILQESLRAVFNAPFYFALTRDAFMSQAPPQRRLHSCR